MVEDSVQFKIYKAKSMKKIKQNFGKNIEASASIFI